MLSIPRRGISKGSFWGISLTLLWALTVPAFCADERTESARGEENTSPVVARVIGREIREVDLDRYIGNEAFALSLKLYSLRRQALESMIESLLFRDEAARQHLTEGELLARIGASAARVQENQIQRGFLDDYDALRPMGEIVGRYRVALTLEDQARTAALRAYLDTLKERANAQVSLRKPEYRLQVRPTACHFGRRDTPSELTVFLDYECPFCQKLEPLLRQLADGDASHPALGISIKHVPLPQHRNAFVAAIAATCASRQNKFRAMHEYLFTTADHASSEILGSAERLGLDMPAFKACLASEDGTSEILQDLAEAKRNGIEGTPSLFLDGTALPNLNNLEELQTLILARVNSRRSRAAGKPGASSQDVANQSQNEGGQSR